MITEILLVILFLFYFQIDMISEYLFQFRHLSSEIIINCFNTSKYIDLIRILTLFVNQLMKVMAKELNTL